MKDSIRLLGIALVVIALAFTACPSGSDGSDGSSGSAGQGVPTATVTYNLSGGEIEGRSGNEWSELVIIGHRLYPPNDPVKIMPSGAQEPGYLYRTAPDGTTSETFLGWFRGDELYNFNAPVHENIALTAKWEGSPNRISSVTQNNLSSAITWINGGNTTNDNRAGTYHMMLNPSIGGIVDSQLATSSAVTLSTGRHLILEATAPVTIYRSSGVLFQLNTTNSSLTIGNNITLRGAGNTTTGNSDSVVNVTGGATFTMKGNSKIINNIRGTPAAVVDPAPTDQGTTAVYIGANSTFNMMDTSEISGNANNHYGTANLAQGYLYGSTVLLYDGGTFNMSGGKITNNNAGKYGEFVAYGGGAQVTLNNANSIFNMTGGEISGNIGNFAGAVRVENGTFNMSDGIIQNNQTRVPGLLYVPYVGGVYVASSASAKFKMTGGSITNNTTHSTDSSINYVADVFIYRAGAIVNGFEIGGSATIGRITLSASANTYTAPYIVVTAPITGTIGLTLRSNNATGPMNTTTDTARAYWTGTSMKIVEGETDPTRFQLRHFLNAATSPTPISIPLDYVLQTNGNGLSLRVQ